MKKIAGLIIIIFLVTGCLPDVSSQATISTPTIFPTLTRTITIPSIQIVQFTSTPLPDVKTPTPLPLQISFPPAQIDPKSIWRPPLYQPPYGVSPHDHFYFIRPISVDEVNWPLADYRYGYIFPNTDQVHTGIDIDAPLNTPIIAAASGTITWAGYGLLKRDNDHNDPYGQAVAIRHDFGYKGLRLITVYAHMSRVDVQVGQVVKQGEQLGIVGMTGNTTGPHVHFEVRLESSTYFSSRNPELWLTPPEGDGLLVGQFLNDYGWYIGSRLITITAPDGQIFEAYTYGPNTINSDDYYKENFVLSDLQAGEYSVTLTYDKNIYTQSITVYPGLSTFFIFKGKSGFLVHSPSADTTTSWLIPYSSR